MNAPDPRPSSYKSSRLYRFVKDRFLSVVLVSAVIVVLAFLIFDVTIPRWFLIVAAAGVAGAPYGVLVGMLARKHMEDPNWVYLVDVDARYVDGAVYRFPYEDFADLDVLGGSLEQWTPRLYAGKDVDLDNGTVTGTWRGTMSDRELIRALVKVRQCRAELEADAKKGFALESYGWIGIRQAVRKTTLEVVETFEDGTLPDGGDALAEQIDEALRTLNLEAVLGEDENPLEDTDELDDLDVDEFADDDDLLDDLLERTGTGPSENGRTPGNPHEVNERR